MLFIVNVGCKFLQLIWLFYCGLLQFDSGEEIILTKWILFNTPKKKPLINFLSKFWITRPARLLLNNLKRIVYWLVLNKNLGFIGIFNILCLQIKQSFGYLPNGLACNNSIFDTSMNPLNENWRLFINTNCSTNTEM